ncbi:unnamed protein product [Acanthoscelides obtectus]|uniref:Uncharacterized protein n=2 Tax=Acanthoscelides obtectus TaxID=200917 RepID=A0A9P0M446_ACAOB|nr:unnamed protein product [Acanthoscelides obtectus]CAK1637325.1 Zinc finger protein 2 [Acanthoscelides obtectus]
MAAETPPSADFQRICRICMKEGMMMSIFKVNISKKIMACASVQVWQNDKLPSQICNKCTAKLHISFQFKKMCEKSDAKLRQILQKMEDMKVQNAVQSENKIVGQSEKIPCLEIAHQQTARGEPAYIECNPSVLEVGVTVPQESHTNYMSQPSQPPLTHMDYNEQQQLQLHGYNIQVIGHQVQVYDSASSYMPLNQMQTADGNVINNQAVTHMQLVAQPEIETLESVMQQQQAGQDHNHQLSHQQIEPPVHVQLPDRTAENDSKSSKSQNKEAKNDASKQCPTCNKVFGTAAKLSRHVKTHSADLPYKCKVCSKGFAHSGNFKIHMRMHTGERPYECVVCGRRSRQLQDLEKHMRVHTGEKPHKCHICNRAFSTSSNLTAHKRTHTGERPYVCCVCQKGFCQSNELTKHMRTHTGEKSHICDICHKGFNGSSTLTVHRRSHTGERPYVCQICGKGFTQSSCLAVHVKRHKAQHGDDDNGRKDMDETTAGPGIHYQCGICGERFSKMADFSKHKRVAHDTGEG